MKIILVCIGNFQEYIVDNIKNLQAFGNTDIVVLTNKEFFHLLEPYNVTLYDVSNLDDFGYTYTSQMNRVFRNGFFMYCSLRLFYLYSYLKTFAITDCVHIENDVMCYVNFDEIRGQFTKNKLYATFDNESRVIPGIIFIPSYTAMTPIIEGYQSHLDDMQNLGLHNEDVVEPLPIIAPEPGENVTKFNKTFVNCIYDAAAMGQYLGGIDPRNREGDTRGFVNEECLIKYDKYKFHWVKVRESDPVLYAPHIVVYNELVRIINLHIHCKRLYNFMAIHPIECKYITHI